MGKTKKAVKYSVVDAFTDSEFKGNPAAVCLLEEEKQDEWLQSVATEFNISETCYLTPFPAFDSKYPKFHLRWFTPVTEVELCGHATLAAAHFCFSSGLVKATTIEFSTLFSGILTARKVFELESSATSESENGEVEQPFIIELDFPDIAITECNIDERTSIFNVMSDADVIDFKKTASGDLIVVLPSAKAVSDARLDFDKIRKCPGRGLIITAAAAPESDFDFFSRFFCPKNGINEDPVCGSAHCALAHYWSKKMGKPDFIAYAASPRSGVVKLHLDDQNNRVKLRGKAVTVMEGSVVV